MVVWLDEGLACLTIGAKNVLKGDLRDDLMKRYIRLFRIVVSRGMPLSKLEILQFGIEFTRLADLHQLYRRGSCDGATAPEVQAVFRTLKSSIDTISSYTAESHNHFMKSLLPVSFL
jgi:hypothetical protein